MLRLKSVPIYEDEITVISPDAPPLDIPALHSLANLMELMLVRPDLFNVRSYNSFDELFTLTWELFKQGCKAQGSVT